MGSSLRESSRDQCSRSPRSQVQPPDHPQHPHLALPQPRPSPGSSEEIQTRGAPGLWICRQPQVLHPSHPQVPGAPVLGPAGEALTTTDDHVQASRVFLGEFHPGATRRRCQPAQGHLRNPLSQTQGGGLCRGARGWAPGGRPPLHSLRHLGELDRSRLRAPGGQWRGRRRTRWLQREAGPQLCSQALQLQLLLYSPGRIFLSLRLTELSHQLPIFEQPLPREVPSWL